MSADNKSMKNYPACNDLVVQCQLSAADYNSFLVSVATVLPAKSDSDVMFCLQSYQGFIIDRSLVY